MFNLNIDIEDIIEYQGREYKVVFVGSHQVTAEPTDFPNKSYVKKVQFSNADFVCNEIYQVTPNGKIKIVYNTQ